MLISLFLLTALQDPALPQPNLQKEIGEAIQQVREGFETLGRSLFLARERMTEERTLDYLAEVDTAWKKADTLVQEMETLLALIPESSSQGGGGSSPQQKEPSPGSKPTTDSKPTPQIPNTPKDRGGGQPIPTSDPELSALFLPPGGKSSWGALPPHLQQVIQNASNQELPLRYKKWLKAYHRESQNP